MLSMPPFDGLRIIRGPLYKSTLLLTAPLLCVLLLTPGSADAPTLYMFFLNMFLYLCFAYAVNDWADREADLAAGKRRTFSSLPASTARAIVVVLLLATLAVGYRHSRSWLYIGVLSTGLLLGVAYSARPFRFKGRGIWGVIIAPLLGKVIPVCLACIHYRRFGWYFLVVALAESVKNAIDILFHPSWITKTTGIPGSAHSLSQGAWNRRGCSCTALPPVGRSPRSPWARSWRGW
jgi:4-hydroxybenzoate polyprenyltransferase